MICVYPRPGAKERKRASLPNGAWQNDRRISNEIPPSISGALGLCVSLTHSEALDECLIRRLCLAHPFIGVMRVPLAIICVARVGHFAFTLCGRNSKCSGTTDGETADVFSLRSPGNECWEIVGMMMMPTESGRFQVGTERRTNGRTVGRKKEEKKRGAFRPTSKGLRTNGPRRFVVGRSSSPFSSPRRSSVQRPTTDSTSSFLPELVVRPSVRRSVGRRSATCCFSRSLFLRAQFWDGAHESLVGSAQASSDERRRRRLERPR